VVDTGDIVDPLAAAIGGAGWLDRQRTSPGGVTRPGDDWIGVLADYGTMTGDESFRTVGLQRTFHWGEAGVTSPERAFALPVGTVTFLLTDVEGSTRLWSTETNEAMQTAIVRHGQLLGAAVDAHGGIRPQEQGEGDSIVAAFARPSDAIRAATAAQLALASEPWLTRAPIRVRMAIHTGEAQLRDDVNYAGQAIIRTARLRALAAGGQVLVSGATRDLAVDQAGGEFALRQLGEVRLRDLGRPEDVWQLVHPDLPDSFPPLAAMDTTPNNLPVSLSPFVGRVTEINDLANIVLAERLVVATGAGGAGKTRIAQQVGAELLDQFPAGVWWIELAPLTTEGVEPAVRAALKISDVTAISLEETVRRKLDGRPSLLIVDNCEHVIDAVSPLIIRLLRCCPTLHVLATSRVALDVPGELGWRIPPLALPDRGAQASVEALSQFDAVRLFCDRALRSRPNFHLTDDNGPAIAEICHRLDGIPLAIELAAARSRVLGPQQILDGLHDAFRILTGGSRTLLPRQQTIEASIAWSHDLLTPAERALFRRLSVFAGGFTLDAAEHICADDRLDQYAIFDALDRLIDHSLIQPTETNGQTRFHLLETVRQYATRQLGVDPSEASATRRGHGQHFAQWLIALRPRFDTEELEALQPVVAAEQDNILVAVQHLVATGDYAGATDVPFALHDVWMFRGWRSLCSSVVAALAPMQASFSAKERSNFLLGKLALAQWQASFADAAKILPASIAAATEAGDIARAAYMHVTNLELDVQVRGAGLEAVVEAAKAVPREPDPYWALRAWERVFIAALSDLKISRLALTYVADFEITSASGRSLVLAARGKEAQFGVRPQESVEVYQKVIRSALTPSWILLATMGPMAFAAVDAGVDLDNEIERICGEPWRTEENPVAGRALAVMRIARCLRDDDIVGALREFRGATTLLRSQGYGHLASRLRTLLLASGLTDVPDDPQRESPSGIRGQAEEAMRSGELPTALAFAHRCLADSLAMERQDTTLEALQLIARILTAAGRHGEAGRLLGACFSFIEERELHEFPIIVRLREGAASQLRAALGDDAFDAAVAEGRTLSLQDAAEYAKRLRTMQVTATVGWQALTPMETKVAGLVAEGKTNPQVAKDLLMSPETVKTHLSRVFTKLGIANRQELVLAATRRRP
jgi:predicted ATPase/class 3 adenylate cyclase/DNA-binding CsgD family transcriptional regulator